MPLSADSSIPEIFEHLRATISSERFLKKQGLNNEIPFYICAFKPERLEDMNALVQQLINQLRNQGVRVLRIDLYDLSIELLTKRGIWNQVLDTEPNISKIELKELLQGVLDPEHHLIPAIAEKMQSDEFEVMFITGVGEVFPYIRSHTVLNNLQSTAKEKPTIMFFPGEYAQSSQKGSLLNLFGRLLDDNYYRAFDIYKHF